MQHPFRTYPTLESCKEACFRSNQHRNPVHLKNGRYAAMTFDEQSDYDRRFLPRGQRCLNCGEPMVEVTDPIAKKKTGHLWRCECMKKGQVLSVG